MHEGSLGFEVDEQGVANGMELEDIEVRIMQLRTTAHGRMHAACDLLDCMLLEDRLPACCM